MKNLILCLSFVVCFITWRTGFRLIQPASSASESTPRHQNPTPGPQSTDKANSDTSSAAQPEYVFQENNEMDTALLSAAQAGETSRVKLLLSRGANPSAKNNDGNNFSALLLAAREGHFRVVKMLVEAGADVNAQAATPTGCCNGGIGGITPLMKAASGGNRAIVKLLLEHGADVTAQDTRIPPFDEEKELPEVKNSTVLFYSADGKILRLLLDWGADPNVKNMGGDTILMLAAQSNETPGGIDFVKVLLEKGADVNLRNKQGKTALTLAQEKGLVETVELLKRAGAKE